MPAMRELSRSGWTSAVERLLILGPPGSGKSTLARTLSAKLDLPVIHLDREYWRSGWIEPPKAEWRAHVAELVKSDRWIMEGGYGDTLSLRLPCAEAVIILDFPIWRCLWRVIMRRFQYIGRARPDMTEGCRERLAPSFLLYILRYRRDTRPSVLAQLRGFERRIITLRTPRAVQAFVMHDWRELIA